MLSKSTSSYLNIQLLEPTIYVEPTSTTTNDVVRGTLNINLPKTMTVQSIAVYFDGKMETDKNSNASNCSANKTLALEHLFLYPTTTEQNDRPLILNAGLTQYGFELQVPSGLPESINCSEVKVNYRISAVMEYYSNNSNRNKLTPWRRASCIKKQIGTQDIHIARLPHSDILMGETMSGPIDSHVHKSTWLDYQIIVNKKAVSLGSELPITFHFTPVIEGGVSIGSVSVQMLEKRCLHYSDETKTSFGVHSLMAGTSSTATTSSTSSNKIPLGKLTKPWEGTINYIIPSKEGHNNNNNNNQVLVHSTQDYSDFNVEHTLLISISLSVRGTGASKGKRVQKMVTFQTQIDVLSETIGELDSLGLPTYDSPPPFDNTEFVFGEYDRKFADPPMYSDIVPNSTTDAGHHYH